MQQETDARDMIGVRASQSKDLNAVRLDSHALRPIAQNVDAEVCLINPRRGDLFAASVLVKHSPSCTCAFDKTDIVDDPSDGPEPAPEDETASVDATKFVGTWEVDSTLENFTRADDVFLFDRPLKSQAVDGSP